ncbi:hypothetical protein FCULG_00004729 [Fusarium culmorum]|uniref:Uncharacterized protein n=1 Tax=Fusarium culmorum TaxID=5516 RepID=A0A2T4H9C4_FUSCU|nr:hypothetical protein FCULG_00004729 [Fusarium culmorum]
MNNAKVVLTRSQALAFKSDNYDTGQFLEYAHEEQRHAESNSETSNLVKFVCTRLIMDKTGQNHLCR